MTPRMEEFLKEAAECETGKGIIFGKYDSRIAHNAARKGYGTIFSSVFSVFVIEDKGRQALADIRGEAA